MKEDPIYSLIKTYNKFIEKLNKMLKKFNPNLIVDEGAKDISRIARPTGSWNIKIGKTARAVGTVSKLSINNNIINSKFMAAKPIFNKKTQEVLRKKSLSKNHRYNYLNIKESPLYKLMVSQYLPSIVSRNHYLEQSFAKLLRDNEIELHQIQDLIQQMDIVQRKNVQVDPDYLDDEKVFNSEAVNSYCIACKIDLVYPLLEDVPEITASNINAAHYKSLDAYSWQTVERMSITRKKPNNYLGLKFLIRTMIDENIERSVIFFTMKTLYKKEWGYYSKNRIISQILNKTRQRK